MWRFILIYLLLAVTSCSYNDICPQRAMQLSEINKAIADEQIVIKSVSTHVKTLDDFSSFEIELQNLDALVQERIEIQNSICD